jgi:hypothetical protein
MVFIDHLPCVNKNPAWNEWLSAWVLSLPPHSTTIFIIAHPPTCAPLKKGVKIKRFPRPKMMI